MRTSTLIDDVIDLMSSNRLDEPADLYRRMITEQPVLWCPVGSGFWIVSSHQLASAVLSNKRGFVRGGHPLFDESSQGTAVLDMLRSSMVQLDEPDHSRLRSIVSQAFTPRSVRTLREHALGAIDRLVAAANGEADLVHEIAYPLTIEMITSMMGLPFSDGEKIVSWTEAIIGYATDSPDDGAVRTADRAASEMHDFFLGHAAERSSGEGSDMISVLARAELGGDRLSKHELAAVCWELVGAGHETTANEIPAAVLTFLRNPDQLDLVRGRPDLLPSAVEECLRYEPVLRAPHNFVATEEVELGDVTVSAGDTVQVWLAAANRDPAVFTDPDKFDITRNNNRHLAFSKGIHFCLGAALARMEIEVALSAILTLPDLALTEPAVAFRRAPWKIRALLSLPVSWDAGAM